MSIETPRIALIALAATIALTAAPAVRAEPFDERPEGEYLDRGAGEEAPEPNPRNTEEGAQSPADDDTDRRVEPMWDTPPSRQPYATALGMGMGPLVHVGRIDEDLESGGVQLRAVGDLMLLSGARIGGQAFVGYSRLQLDGDAVRDDGGLNVFEVGAGLFRHVPLSPHVSFTPLIAWHAVLTRPGGGDESFVGFGARAEASLDLVPGPDGRGTVSLTPFGLQVYLPAASLGGDGRATAHGLDRRRTSFTFTVTYRVRFSGTDDPPATGRR